MGVVSAMDRLTEIVEAVTPLQRPGDSLHHIDAHASSPLEEVALRRDRCFDLGTVALPVDDGEAGAADCGTLRVRVGLVLRIGYRLDDRQDRRLLDGMVAEDVRLITTALMVPSNWDAATTGIISILPPEVASVTRPEGGGLIVALPLIMLYREEV